METIYKYFRSQFGNTENDWQIFSSKLEKKEYSKKSTILKLGGVENYLSFIEQGIVRYYIPKDENDLTFGFVFSGSFSSAYDSFITRQPSKYTI